MLCKTEKEVIGGERSRPLARDLNRHLSLLPKGAVIS